MRLKQLLLEHIRDKDKYHLDIKRPDTSLMDLKTTLTSLRHLQSNSKAIRSAIVLLEKNLHISKDLAFKTFVGIICQFHISKSEIILDWCLYFEKNDITLEDIEYWIDDSLNVKYGKDVGLLHRLIQAWKKSSNETDIDELADNIRTLIKYKASQYRIGYYGKYTVYDVLDDCPPLHNKGLHKLVDKII